MNSNPWNVQTLDEFLFYCCPECDNKYVTKSHFVEHALTSHQVSQQYIPSVLQNMMSIANVKAVTKLPREIVTKPLVNHPVLQNVISELNEEIELNDREKNANSQEIITLDSDEEETQPQTLNSDSILNAKPNSHVDKSQTVKNQSRNQKVKNQKVKNPKMKTLLLYKCDQCGKNLKSKSNLEDHLRNFHTSGSLNKRLKCDMCDKILGTTSAMKYHMEYVHNKDYHLPGKSQKESQPTENVTPLTPMQSVTIQEMNDVVTPVTPMLNVTSALAVPILSEKENNNKYGHGNQYVCEKCDKSFKQKSYLKAHIENVHEGVTHICDICEKEFSSKGALAGHKRQIHPNENTKKYQCPQCHYFTYIKALFRNHIQNKHVLLEVPQ